MAIFETPEIFLISICIFFLFYSISRRGKTSSEPTNWPLLGMLPAVLQNLNRGHDYATQVLIECGGTYKFKGPWLWNIDMLFTCDPANIHHIFSKNFSNYPKGPEFRKIFEILGDGIFNADSEMWELHRRTTLALITRTKFYGFLERTVWRKVETGLIPVLEYFLEKGTGFDLQDIFQRFTFDTACVLFLENDPNSLCIDLPHVPCEKAFGGSTEAMLHRHIIPERIWKLQKWLNIGTEKKLHESWKAFDEFIYPRVSMEEEQNGELNLLTTFTNVYKKRNKGSTIGLKDFLRDTVLNLMFAGRDTTSTCLTWLFYLIALNPSVEIKILEEIKAKVLDVNADKKLKFFNIEDTHKLVYLHGALCESLRLYPPVALEHKEPVRPDTLPSGHYLRENTKVIFSFYSVGRMESVWGKDCLEFKPERWISVGGGIKHEPSYKFPAFNVGPRTCIGKEMAFIQMKIVAATVLYHYRVQLVEGHPVSPRIAVILSAKHGLRVRLSRRNI